LDISKNTSLEWLNIGGNYLTNLDISGNNELTELSCDAIDFSVDNQLADKDFRLIYDDEPDWDEPEMPVECPENEVEIFV
jgi:hypothetical protein